MAAQQATGRKRGRTFLSGSVAGLMAGVTFQPFDVVRTVQQSAYLRGQSRCGPLQAATQVIQEDGVRGLWRGLAPSSLRVLLGAGVYFSSLHELLYLMDHSPRARDAPAVVKPFIAGAAARCIAASLLCPIAVIKTRMEFAYGRQGGGHSRPYTGTWSALRHIARSEGVRGLFSGLLPTMLRDAPFSGIYYTLFDAFRVHWLPSPGSLGVPVAAHTFGAGVIAGVVSTLAVHPADVLKTRLQLKSAEFLAESGRVTGVPQPSGAPTIRSEISSILTTEGFPGLFRGAMARVSKRALSTALTWAAFEELMAAVRRAQDRVLHRR